ncbi:MAG: hypothetical protein AB8B58_10530 [Roseobacter sp.]
MRALIILVPLLLASTVAAQEWALRSGDRELSRAEIVELTTDSTLTFYDDGQSQYATDGAYSYTYASGESAFGRYEVEADGTVCVYYPNGFSRCDRYVDAGARIVLLDERGQRFPLKAW